ncbi:hypothetical protein B0H17DRAFT_1134831 [Mycena rosella]|uniref:Uncharacterized protein n=1 Tax=Mycena rosella TaxID=1033263 RepID=A0AAD7DGF7_MYCRO|nr:hypothetical protein B0H17DRAFT_1134831 [Mycena rosella]
MKGHLKAGCLWCMLHLWRQESRLAQLTRHLDATTGVFKISSSARTELASTRIESTSACIESTSSCVELVLEKQQVDVSSTVMLVIVLKQSNRAAVPVHFSASSFDMSYRYVILAGPARWGKMTQIASTVEMGLLQAA